MGRAKIAMLFASNLKAIMEMRGLDPAKLSRAAVMNPTAIYDILSGKSKNPRLDTVEKIANALDVPPSALFAERHLDELHTQLYGVLMNLDDAERERLLVTANAWAVHTQSQVQQ